MFIFANAQRTFLSKLFLLFPPTSLPLRNIRSTLPARPCSLGSDNHQRHLRHRRRFEQRLDRRSTDILDHTRDRRLPGMAAQVKKLSNPT